MKELQLVFILKCFIFIMGINVRVRPDLDGACDTLRTGCETRHRTWWWASTGQIQHFRHVTGWRQSTIIIIVLTCTPILVTLASLSTSEYVVARAEQGMCPFQMYDTISREVQNQPMIHTNTQCNNFAVGRCVVLVTGPWWRTCFSNYGFIFMLGSKLTRRKTKVKPIFSVSSCKIV